MINIIKIEKNDCPKCDAMRPMLESIEGELEADGIRMLTVNTDERPETIEAYGISSVPVLIIQKDGIETRRLNGVVKPFEIFAAIDAAKEN